MLLVIIVFCCYMGKEDWNKVCVNYGFDSKEDGGFIFVTFYDILFFGLVYG